MQLLPSILAAIIGTASIFSPQLNGVVSNHPAVAGVLAAVYAILSHLLPSPLATLANPKEK